MSSLASTRSAKDCLMVSSKALDDAAGCWGEADDRELANGVRITKAQVITAARLIKEAGVCRIDYPHSMRSESELPAFIHRERQTEAGVLILDIGILPQRSHWIDRTGEVIEPGCPCVGHCASY